VLSASRRSLEPPFGLHREDEGDVPVLVVQGEVDVATAPQLREALESLQGASVVDLCETAFMDSTGLQVLLAAGRASDGRLHIACLPAGPVRRLFEVTAARALLPIHSSRDAALAAFSGTAI
jgi:anti-sigma B factor antagonist